MVLFAIADMSIKSPRFRTDLEILDDSVPGGNLCYLIKDPINGEIVRLNKEELFLCQHFDGDTSPEELIKLFENHFHKTIPLDALQGFIQSLDRRGLFSHSKHPGLFESPVDELKVVMINANGFFDRLYCFLGWTCSYPAKILSLILITLALGILVQNWTEIYFKTTNLIDVIVVFGMQEGPPWQVWIQISLILFFIPFLREIQKGITCRHFGIPVIDARYGFYLGFIPLFFTNISAMMVPRFKQHRLRVMAAGVWIEINILAISMVCWHLMPEYQPEKDFFYGVSMAAFVSLMLNAIPLGKKDGSRILGVWLGVPNFRSRATAVSRAWLRFRTPPEALSHNYLRLFRWYGLWADIFQLTLVVTLLSLLGYLLVSWLEGIGALVFLTLVILNWTSSIRRITMGINSSAEQILSQWVEKSVAKFLIRGGVVTLLVLIGMLPYTSEVSGEFRVRPIQQHEIRAGVTSQVEQVLAQDGEWVEEGQLIAHLTKRFIEKELDTTKAALEREEAVLRDLQAGPKPEEIAEAEQQVQLAVISLSHSKKALVRAKKLLPKKYISQEDYDTAKDRVEYEKATLELRKRNLALVKSGATNAEIETQEAQIQRLQESIKHLKKDLSYTSITSPISGQITSLSLEALKGQSVTVGDMVAKVSDTSSVNIRIAIHEEDIDQVNMGALVRARTWSDPDRQLEGTVTEISPIVVDKVEDIRRQAEIEQESGSVRSLNAPMENVVPVIVKIPNPDGKLITDMSGFAKIEVESRMLAGVVFNPIIRFFKVRVWSWLP